MLFYSLFFLFFKRLEVQERRIYFRPNDSRGILIVFGAAYIIHGPFGAPLKQNNNS
jgi:hypothetical protein